MEQNSAQDLSPASGAGKASPRAGAQSADAAGDLPEQDGTQGGDQPSPTDFTGKTKQQQSCVSPSVIPLQTDGWFLQKDITQRVHFPARQGNIIIPYYSSKECMDHIDRAIRKAQKSICIITWGMDTDIRLRHKGAASEYYRTLDYNYPFYPAAQSPEHTDIYGKKRTAATPDADSDVLADLLVSATERGVQVRLLVWEPALTANNVLDPLHLWWRSKTGMIKNMEFAFRAYEGEKMDKPSKVYLQGSDTGRTKSLAEANQRLQDTLDTATSDSAHLVYNMLYTHHQKEILIDIEDPARAVGFITGFNLKEEYWDSSDHWPGDDTRLPYAPWQDLGVRVQGPVLHDMAWNFKESWTQMLMEGKRMEALGGLLAAKLYDSLPFSTQEDAAALAEARQRWDVQAQRSIARDARTVLNMTNEVYPEHLIGAALAAGLGSSVQEKALHTKGVFYRYDIRQGSLELSTPAQWDYKLAPQCMELCLYLTTLSMIFYGIMTKSFSGDGMLRPAREWDIPIPRPWAFMPPDDTVPHSAQFFRTFPLAEVPKEVSIFQAYINAIRNVQNGQFVYIENQYFRDEYIVGELILRRRQGRERAVPGRGKHPRRRPHEALPGTAGKIRPQIQNMLAAGEGTGGAGLCPAQKGPHDGLSCRDTRQGRHGRRGGLEAAP